MSFSIYLCIQKELIMETVKNIIITLFSDQTVRLSEDSISDIRKGIYPARVKSKILAAIRGICSDRHEENLVGFLPVVEKSNKTMMSNSVEEDNTQDHYGDLSLYLSPEVPCNVVTDLLNRSTDGSLVCREDLVNGSNVTIISDDCSDWTELECCMVNAGAKSINCIAIIG